MKAKRWLFSAKKYVEAEVDDCCAIIAIGLSDLVTCPGCGKAVTYGKTYTSLEWFDYSGMWGMAVCGDCYWDEVDRQEKAKLAEKEEKEDER